MVGRKTSRSVCDDRGITFSGKASSNILTVRHPESFRARRVRCRHGETKPFWVFTKVVRRKRYGRKRLVLVHAQEDLGEAPRLLLTDALHGESGRVLETWSS